jgi:hypothetical protein
MVRPFKRIQRKKEKIGQDITKTKRSQSSLLTGKFSEEELNQTIKDFKNRKAAGLDNITTDRSNTLDKALKTGFLISLTKY